MVVSISPAPLSHCFSSCYEGLCSFLPRSPNGMGEIGTPTPEQRGKHPSHSFPCFSYRLVCPLSAMKGTTKWQETRTKNWGTKQCANLEISHNYLVSVWCWRCIHSEMEYDEHLLNIANAKGWVFSPCEKGAKEIERMKKTQICSTKMCSDRERREHPNCGISRQTQTIENWRPATPPRVGPFF